ncbi:MAG: hypothetical protein HC772_05590, partial [Leptolyngbyaceae cyanobacterium CRU_2_3]|nr:hypothetical protein [Leptolyngbyaceae cyanobacterium CRU_2_3]
MGQEPLSQATARENRKNSLYSSKRRLNLSPIQPLKLSAQLISGKTPSAYLPLMVDELSETERSELPLSPPLHSTSSVASGVLSVHTPN